MTQLAPPSVRLLVCGNADRGDDGAALSAVATLLPSLPSAMLERLEVRRCGHLRVEDLLEVPEGEVAVVVDAAVGIAPRPPLAPRTSCRWTRSWGWPT